LPLYLSVDQTRRTTPKRRLYLSYQRKHILHSHSPHKAT